MKKEKHTKSKASRRKKIINIKAKINDTESRKIEKSINQKLFENQQN